MNIGGFIGGGVINNDAMMMLVLSLRSLIRSIVHYDRRSCYSVSTRATSIIVPLDSHSRMLLDIRYQTL